MRTIIRDNYDPKLGDYHERIVIDEAREKRWLFDCDGVFIDITEVQVVNEKGDSTEYAISQKLFTDTTDKLASDLADEVEARGNADQEIWTEIETIEAASDVVDVVGTYAELQQYDTSDLHDKDLIKVLQDETRDDAITYYRWSTSTETFSYVGEEGPYYTQSQTDVLLGGKQDTLIAGTNIQIASDGKTISATDTTYSDFTGATAQQAGAHGLVPAPTTSDPDNFLKGDGTWGRVASLETSTSPSTTGTFYDYYVQSADGQHRLGFDVEVNSNTGDVENAYLYLDDTYPLMNILPAEQTQEKLVAGSNIQIAADGVTISATDTTYSAFTGTDGQTAGAAGLVPAPATTDAGKFLKADGTWANASYSDFVGATAQQAGVHGLVPAPTTSDKDKFLKGDGTWTAETTYSTGTSSVSGITKLYTTTGQNTDGAVTQKLFTDTVGDIEAALIILNSGAGVP